MDRSNHLVPCRSWTGRWMKVAKRCRRRERNCYRDVSNTFGNERRSPTSPPKRLHDGDAVALGVEEGHIETVPWNLHRFAEHFAARLAHQFHGLLDIADRDHD